MQYFHISIPYDPGTNTLGRYPKNSAASKDSRFEKGGNPFENRKSNHLQPRMSASYVFTIYLQLGTSKSFETHFEGISTGPRSATHCYSVSTSQHIDE
jgi:hypothetical protein